MNQAVYEQFELDLRKSLIIKRVKFKHNNVGSSLWKNSWTWGLDLTIYNIIFIYINLSKIYLYRLEIGLYKFVNRFI